MSWNAWRGESRLGNGVDALGDCRWGKLKEVISRGRRAVGRTVEKDDVILLGNDAFG